MTMADLASLRSRCEVTSREPDRQARIGNRFTLLLLEHFAHSMSSLKLRYRISRLHAHDAAP
jgi:hypothetical protein